MIKMLFLLIASHCLADTALQTEFMAKGKNRNTPIDLSRVPPGQKPIKLWWMWLTHHAMIHGGLICLLTDSLLFGIIETLSHWIIDFFKCENKYNPFVDQILHVAIKIMFIVLIMSNIK